MEAMSEKAIGEIVKSHAYHRDSPPHLCLICILIFTWAVAKAEAERAEWQRTNHCITAERKGDGVVAYRSNFDDNDPRHKWAFGDWLNAVLARIGWPKDGGQGEKTDD